MRKGIVWVVVCILFVVVVSVGLVACGSTSDPAPSATTYSISGTATSSSTALQGATMTLSGARAATATTDASGNYTFAGLSNGSYTLTPSKTGYTFTPANSSQTVSGANITGVNFTATVTASASDYAGTWKGSMVVSSETRTTTLTLSSSLTGSYAIQSATTPATHNLTTPALVTNGTLSLSLPLCVEDAASTYGPAADCVGWSVACAGTLSDIKSTLTLSCSGLFCSTGGATYGSFTDVMTKQSSSNADVGGYWLDSTQHYWSLSQTGTTVTGSFICPNAPVHASTMQISGSVSGNNFSLSFHDDGCVNQLTGSVSGNTMSGSITGSIDTSLGECSDTPGTEAWSATKLTANPCP